MPLERLKAALSNDVKQWDQTLWHQALQEQDVQQLYEPGHAIWSDPYAALQLCVRDYRAMEYVHEALIANVHWWAQAVRSNRGYIKRTPKEHLQHWAVLQELMRSKVGCQYLKEQGVVLGHKYQGHLWEWVKDVKNVHKIADWSALWESALLQHPKCMVALLKVSMEHARRIDEQHMQYYAHLCAMQEDQADPKQPVQDSAPLAVSPLQFLKQLDAQQHKEYQRVANILMMHVIEGGHVAQYVWEKIALHLPCVSEKAVQVIHKNPQRFLDLGSHLQDSVAVALQVLQKVNVYALLPTQMQLNEQVMCACIKQRYDMYPVLVGHQGDARADGVLQSRVWMEKLLDVEPGVWQHLQVDRYELHRQLKDDVRCISALLQADGNHWSTLSEPDKAKQEYMLLSVMSAPMMLRHAPKEWLLQEAFMDACCERNGMCVQFAPKSYRARMDKMLPLIQKDVRLYIHVHGALKSAQPIVDWVLQHNAKSLYDFLPKELKANAFIVLKAFASIHPIQWRQVSHKVQQRMRTMLGSKNHIPSPNKYSSGWNTHPGIESDLLQALQHWCAKKQAWLLERQIADKAARCPKNSARL